MVLSLLNASGIGCDCYSVAPSLPLAIQPPSKVAADTLAQKAKNNTKENFKFSYEKAFMDFVISRMSQNEQFFLKMLENNDFKTLIMEDMFEEVYEGLRQ